MKTLHTGIILLLAALWFGGAAHAEQNILVFGDSLSAGYGMDAEKSWPALLQQEFEGTDYRVVNASVSGETTLGGRQRIAKALLRYRPAVVILELGVNDGLRGQPPADIEANLNKLILDIKRHGASVLLVGMRLPPNAAQPDSAGPDAAQFEAIYPRLAKARSVRLLPYLLEGVPPEHFQPDRLHPAAEAQPLLMRRVLKELKPLLD